MIGIASMQAKSSLSVMYPGTDKPLLILSRDNVYASALFVSISGQEYLAAASRDGIYLWNLEDNTSRVVYGYKEEKDWLLCLRTVASAAMDKLSSFLSIYILKTDTEMWTLSSTHLVKVADSVSDMSYVKTKDGTTCLLLIDHIGLFHSVELVGGKVHWQTDKQQMGALSYPLSICTDGSTVFVSDLYAQLHLLSVEDGSVLTSINLRPFGLLVPSCVRLQGDHLYIGHKNQKGDTYCISKRIKQCLGST